MIEGLTVINKYITEAEQKQLLNWIDSQSWNTELSRRVQHYGWQYDYKARAVVPELFIGPLPLPLLIIAQALHSEGLMPQLADQVIVNEYLPGQGIAAHVDCVPCFEDGIASLTLGSHCVMQMAKGDEKHDLLLLPGSLLVLQGEARYAYTHAIPARKTDTWQGQKLPRGRRVSVTFRRVRKLGLHQ